MTFLEGTRQLSLPGKERSRMCHQNPPQRSPGVPVPAPGPHRRWTQHGQRCCNPWSKLFSQFSLTLHSVVYSHLCAGHTHQPCYLDQQRSAYGQAHSRIVACNRSMVLHDMFQHFSLDPILYDGMAFLQGSLPMLSFQASAYLQGSLCTQLVVSPQLHTSCKICGTAAVPIRLEVCLWG